MLDFCGALSACRATHAHRRGSYYLAPKIEEEEAGEAK